jgi:hypothetical protein
MEFAGGDGRRSNVVRLLVFTNILSRLFIVEGAATVGWALVAGFILLDFPANSKGLTEREREIAIARLQDGGVRTHTEGDERMGKRKSFMMAITDWRVGGLILGYMACTPPLHTEILARLTDSRLSSDPPPSPTSILPSSEALATQAPSRHST